MTVVPQRWPARLQPNNFVLATDLDGTLLAGSPAARRRVRELFAARGAGARLVFVTGRCLESILPLLSIGLFGFAWTSLGPPQVHWIAPMIFSVYVAIANYAIYMSTIDYMVAAYGVYSASATGGNGFARAFLAGVSSMYATVSSSTTTSHHGSH